MAMSSPLMEITLEGDLWTIKNSSLMRTVVNTFKLGEEYEEKMPSNTIKVNYLHNILVFIHIKERADQLVVIVM